jgi:hypothetical protein
MQRNAEARMTDGANDEARMTNDERNSNAPAFAELRPGEQMTVVDAEHFPTKLIATSGQLADLLKKIDAGRRVAVDTEADSLHSYREKLCLVQISVSAASTPVLASRSEGAIRHDFIVDPLADVDLAPLRVALEEKEIVLHGADFDLRMLRRGLQFKAREIFDTVIAARLLGIREFSLAALVKGELGAAAIAETHGGIRDERHALLAGAGGEIGNGIGSTSASRLVPAVVPAGD